MKVTCKFKCMKCNLKWNVKKNLKSDKHVTKENCPNCNSVYKVWTNYEKLFGNMTLQDLHEL